MEGVPYYLYINQTGRQQQAAEQEKAAFRLSHLGMALSHLHERSPATVVTVNVTAAKELVASAGLRYLDVRTEEEWSKGHLDDSLNVPYMFITSQGREKNPLFVEQAASLFTKEEHVVVGCQSGKRSELACVDLLAAGFKNVKNMGGGYADWLQNGFPVHNPPRSG